MALDPKTKRPIICDHKNVEQVIGDEAYRYVCKDCGLRFANQPPSKVRPKRSRHGRKEEVPSS